MADANPNTQGQFDQTAAGANSAWVNVATMAAQNAVTNQQAMNMLGLSVVAKNTDVIANLQPAEAKAQTGILESGLAKSMSDLGAAVANVQQSIKGALTTPPVTAKPE